MPDENIPAPLTDAVLKFAKLDADTVSRGSVNQYMASAFDAAWNVYRGKNTIRGDFMRGKGALSMKEIMAAISTKVKRAEAVRGGKGDVCELDDEGLAEWIDSIVDISVYSAMALAKTCHDRDDLRPNWERNSSAVVEINELRAQVAALKRELQTFKGE